MNKPLHKSVRQKDPNIEEEKNAGLFHYQRYFSTTPDFVGLVNQNYVYLMVNEAYEKAFAKPAAEIVGITVADLQGKEIFENEFKALYDQALTGETVSYARWYDLPALGRRFLSVTLHPVPDASGKVNIVTINAHDITDHIDAEQSLQRIFEASRDMIGVIGFNGRFKQMNPSWTRILGWSVDELLDQRMLNYIHPDDLPVTIQEGRELVAGKEMMAFENRFRCKDDEYRWLSWNAFPDKDREEIFAVARDITEEKVFEKTLKESEIRFRALFEESPVPLMEQDFSAIKEALDRLELQKGFDLNEYLLDNPAVLRALAEMIKMLAVNNAAIHLFRAQAAADVLSDPSRFFMPESYEDFRKELVSLSRGARHFTHEIKRQTLNGKALDLILDLNVAPGYADSWGKIFVSMMDITARKRAEDALIASEKKYRTIFDSAGDAILVQELEGRFLDVNSVACQLLGYTRTELLAMTPEEIESSILTVKTSLILHQVFNKGRVHLETNYTRKDGVEIPVWVNAQYIVYDGIPALLQITRDISERKHLEDELKLLATLDPLTSANNRRHFLELAEMELKRSRRYNSPLTLLLIDVDYFKSVNDTYGHAAGDDALQALVDKCLTTLRVTDLFGRMGGEEFAAVLVETDAEAALVTANRLRQAVADMTVTTQGEDIHFTISIGVASQQGAHTSLDRLMKRADIALYEAKRSGRNRVCSG